MWASIQYCVRLSGQQSESRAKASEVLARSGRFKGDILFQQGREKVETGARPERVLIKWSEVERDWGHHKEKASDMRSHHGRETTNMGRRRVARGSPSTRSDYETGDGRDEQIMYYYNSNIMY